MVSPGRSKVAGNIEGLTALRAAAVAALINLLPDQRVPASKAQPLIDQTIVKPRFPAYRPCDGGNGECTEHHKHQERQPGGYCSFREQEHQ
jgi:hypothetical protein